MEIAGNDQPLLAPPRSVQGDGGSSQWEPRLFENLNPIEPPHRETYHLSEDLADQAIGWMHRPRSFAPDQPFFMYWAPGAGHGPHHIFKAWADRYKGKFDAGWDALRETTFKHQKELGWIPADTQLTPRAASMPGWDSIPESERPFQRRLMEVFAGFDEESPGGRLPVAEGGLQVLRPVAGKVEPA